MENLFSSYVMPYLQIIILFPQNFRKMMEHAHFTAKSACANSGVTTNEGFDTGGKFS